MSYTLLSKLYYKSETLYEETYRQRFDGEYSIKLDFSIGGAQAFFVQTAEVYQLLTSILRMNHAVSNLCWALPDAAIVQFTRRCLIDEIVLTNNIEGVRSTRKEISDILDELELKSKGKKRFHGLVLKYYMLMTKEELPLEHCEDLRSIYDELVLEEVKEEDPDNLPDGKWFRKGPVSIYSPSQKELHKGLYPEPAIISALEQALGFLHDDSCEILYRVAIFHYLLEYIHPFYDGNGRLGRFICSYLLSQELEPVIGYRLSYTIKEHITEYYKAFTLCNDPLNKGDLTPFLLLFLRIIHDSMEKLKESLQERFTRLNRLWKKIPSFVGEEDEKDEKLMELYGLLLQAALFSECGIPTEVVLNHTKMSRVTLYRRMEKIPPGLLVKTRQGKTNYYSLNVEKLEKEG